MNVLLDLDGTLTDPKKGIVGCIQHALRCLGQDVPEEAALLRYIGPPLQAAFRELLPVDRESETERAIAKYRERYSVVGIFENSVYPGVPEALELLRSRGARLFVATSKPSVYARRLSPTIIVCARSSCELERAWAIKSALSARVPSSSLPYTSSK